MSRSPVAESVLRMDLPLCPGSMTINGALAVGGRDGLGELTGVGVGTGPTVVGAGATGLGLGLAVDGSGEKTVWGGAGSSGRAWGSEEPQPARTTTRPMPSRATHLSPCGAVTSALTTPAS
jgi:hypothetical protein